MEKRYHMQEQKETINNREINLQEKNIYFRYVRAQRENYKTLLKKCYRRIKQMENYTVLKLEDSIIKVLTILKMFYNFNAILKKIPLGFYIQ